jgi:uncharacterized cupredoxin-like copper-binding protein
MNLKQAFPVLAVAGMLPLLAHADAGHDMKHMPMEDHAQYKGHAAALGKPAKAAQATRTVEVTMSDAMRFEPERIQVKRGETIRFVVHNQGQVKHEMVLGTMAELKEHAAMMLKFPEMEHDDPNAVHVEPGKSGEFAWTFSKAGTFDFACLMPGHFEAGMKGKIVTTK